jgi:glycine betaine catabolism B
MNLELFDLVKDFGKYLLIAKNKLQPYFMGAEGEADYSSSATLEAGRQAVTALHPERLKLRVEEIIEETPSTKTFRFRSVAGELPHFRPGQYVNLCVEIDGVLTSRPYSISSAPGNDCLDLTVKDNPGGFVAPYLLREVKLGGLLECSAPAGSFVHEPLIDGDDLVFLAGGSGITPFMSIIRDQTERGFPLKISLLYGSRLVDDVIFGGELAQLAKEYKNFRYKLVISEPPEGYKGETGFLDEKCLTKHLKGLNNKRFFICGPHALHDLCTRSLEKLGVPSHRIRREIYGPPPDVSLEAGWPSGLSPDTVFEVRVEGRKTILARAGEPLMNSLERNGINLPALCRTGECSYCRIRLLAGRVFMPERTGLRESDRDFGYIHGCVSYSVENLTIRIY